ncbi:MAG TPA: PAS domain S-box protein [Candidatus Limnocylindrales bacterium]
MARPTVITSTRLPTFGRRALAVLTTGALALAALVATPGSAFSDVLYLGTSALAAGACLLGIRTGRHEARGAWGAVAAALVMMSLGNAVALGDELPGMSGLGYGADVMFLAAYLPLFFASYRFGRGTHRSDRTVILDASIVGLAAVPFVWELLVEPNLPGVVTGMEAILAIAIPIGDIVLLSLAAPLLLFRYARSASAAMFVAGLLAMAAGDSVFALGTLNGAWASSAVPKAGWLASYVLLAGASLVPSAARLGAARDPRPGSGDSIRLAVLAAALLVSPLAMLRESSRSADLNLMAFAIIALVIASLVVLRLQRTIAQLGFADARLRRFLSHDGFVAVIKDADGRYAYMNDVAQRIAGGADSGWYGRTDAELFPADVAARRGQADAAVRRTREPIVETVEAEGRVFHTERFAIPGKGNEVAVLGVDITERLRAEDEVRFQARLLESVRDAIVVVDTSGHFTYWNRGAEEMFGLTSAEVLGQDMRTVITPGSRDQVEALWGAVGRGETELGEWETTRRDGTSLWLNVRMSPIADERGVRTGFLALIKDVTARKQAELELRRLGLAIDRANDAIIVTDGDDRVTYVNPAFERMTGFAAGDVLGQRPSDHPAGRPFGRALEQARRSAAGWRGDLIDRRRDGSDLVAQTSISPISVDGAPNAGFVTIKRDVTQERAAERAAERRARERALIAETLASLRVGESPEETAEAVCRQLTKLPELTVGSLITFGEGRATVLAQAERHGTGLPGLDLSPERSQYLLGRAEAGPWVERWIADESHPYHAKFLELGVMANAYAPLLVGDRPIGLLVGGSDQIDAVERLAERLPALVEFAAIASTLLAGPVADRLAVARLRDALRGIIDAQRFEVHFQPIVDLTTGTTRGYEALTRFDDGTPPDVRFQQATDLGLGLDLEAACIRAALAGAKRLPAETWLNINVSPEVVLGGLAETLIPPTARDVVLEITEHRAITDYARFREAVMPIRDRVRIAIDDAGAGFASLRHIVELAPSLVKLDRSLVAGIGDDRARQAVVSGMVQFARSAGLMLVAEGIETEEELAVLRRLGVELGQGYLLGVPRPVSEVARLDSPRPMAAPNDNALHRPSRQTRASAPAPPALSR